MDAVATISPTTIAITQASTPTTEENGIAHAVSSVIIEWFHGAQPRQFSKSSSEVINGCRF